jgi:hypothetical protein
MAAVSRRRFNFNVRPADIVYIRTEDHVIESRNLRGRPEVLMVRVSFYLHDEETTCLFPDVTLERAKLFMHGDYQMAYCPIARVVPLAFRDNAFENDRHQN